MGDLRPYQAAAVESALRALTISGSAVLQMPTGAGKTKAATEIIKRADKPVWFICHRQEIERQAADAFSAAGIKFGIVSPRGQPEYDKPVQIVSVAALKRRIADLPLPALAIWDECHHAPAKSWAAIRAQLGGAQNLGLTATPERLDGKGLSDWFADLVVGPTIEDLIADGWLSKFRYFAPSDPDLAAAKMQAGDYNKKDADKAMNKPVLIGDAVAEYRRNAAGKRAIAFCTSIEASKALVERFNREGIPAAHVDGDTPTDQRDEAVRQLADGEIRVLSNVDVFTEGFDVPGIDAVILLRPTKSPTLLLQMIGRALRVAPGKDCAIIMDHAGLWQDHGSFAENWHWSLEGGAAKARRKAGERGPRRCPECKEVFAEREPVCACGYEFPTGREVGEFDGVLTEVRDALPQGVVTRNEFEKLIGISKGCLFNQIRKGLPTDSRGNIIVNEGIRWLIENPPVGIPPLFVENQHDYESLACFERRIGRKDLAYVHGGTLPRASNGWVHVPSALQWIYENDHKTRKIKGIAAGIASKSEFARIIGISNGAPLASMIKRGLPFRDGGIPVDAGIEWVRRQNSNRRPPMGVKDPNNYESARAFSIRLCIDPHTIPKFAERGLPCASNGWVHIQRGLEWVRDNTNIVIPPEAWPDSDAPTKRAPPPQHTTTE